MVKRPVSRSLARAFFYIVLLSLLTTGGALFTLSSSMRDAEAINIAGSLRMQSYRLGYDLLGAPGELTAHRRQYENTLHSPVLNALGQGMAPLQVQVRYQALHRAWQEMDNHLTHKNVIWYENNISGYVAQIDDFVLALQHYAERKMMLAVMVSALGFIAMFTLVFFTLRRIRCQVVAPLNALVIASEAVKRGDFSPPSLDVKLPNELGQLAFAFTRMSGELGKLYLSLEASVQQKTQRLEEAHRRLEVLYRCSRTLNTSIIDRRCFEKILSILRLNTQLITVEMRTDDNGLLRDGLPDATIAWHSVPIRLQENVLGELRWQTDALPPSPLLMESIASMLGQGIWVNQAQKHHQQLLLMEERATIARELHDSLAQVLSYLRIQMTLLRHSVEKENTAAHAIIDDFSQALNDAYSQLRELLTTFRLTLQQTNLTAALQEMVATLRSRTTATIHVTCSLPDSALDAQRQIHLLQIIREALLNAIRHANADTITVRCSSTTSGIYEAEVIDDGCGIASLDEPEGHYGLTIMQERAGCLGGKLSITRPAQGGTCVCLHFAAVANENEALNSATAVGIFPSGAPTDT